MKDGVTVINIMKDGTTCNDLSKYPIKPEDFPKDAARLILEFIKDGYAQRNSG